MKALLLGAALSLVACNACSAPFGWIGQPSPAATVALPPAVKTLCEQACEICVPSAVAVCAQRCDEDQALGVATQMNPAQVVDAGTCPNP